MARKSVKHEEEFEIHTHFEQKIKNKPKKFKFTPKQIQLLDKLLDPTIWLTFISGPAGTSKTYMALYAALDLMSKDPTKELVYVRSIIESADKGLGSLPGDIQEKFDPFLMPLYDKLDEIIFPEDVVFLKKQEKIAAVPINFLRGANWDNKIVVADESQNFTFKELTTLITRVGPNTKLIVCGDYGQSDINGRSGFKKMKDLFDDEDARANGICSFAFSHEDIVRHERLKFVLERIEKCKNI